VGDIRFGRFKPVKTSNFGRVSRLHFTNVQMSTSLARGRHVLICSAPQLQQCLINLLTCSYTVSEPILQSVCGIHCNLSSVDIEGGGVVLKFVSPIHSAMLKVTLEVELQYAGYQTDSTYL